MNVRKTLVLFFSFLFLAYLKNPIQACSMYKITSDGKTMVGCNHDTWFSTPKIWFKNANNPNEYGAGFTGAREVSAKSTAPQSGMNTAGLTFSRLVAYYPKQKNPFVDRLKISNEVDYLTQILQKCSNVTEVKEYIEQYDHSFFLEDIFIYTDSLGKYLIVEPYSLFEGNESNYIQANFCPSITNKKQARKQERFRNGEDFIKSHPLESSLDYCTDLSDAMHVCRNRNGDGTLITSIWNTKDKSVNLFFYHNYDSTIQFNLIEELAKGDRILSISALFPRNSEFERLIEYKTPFNHSEIRISLVFLAFLLAFFSFFLFITVHWKKDWHSSSKKSVIPMILMNLLLIAYLFVLATNKGIFYFDAPFKHYNSNFISASSYTPFLLLLLIGPLLFFSVKTQQLVKYNLWIKSLLVSNLLIYFVLLAGFSYWGLFDVLN